MSNSAETTGTSLPPSTPLLTTFQTFRTVNLFKKSKKMKNSYNPFYSRCYPESFFSSLQLFQIVGNALLYCLTNLLNRCCSKHILKL